MKFFDGNVWAGSPPEPTFRQFDKPEDLLAQMARSRTAGALVTHFASLTYDWRDGNDMAVDWARDERLHVAIAMVPDATGEVGGVGEYLDKAIGRGARAVRLFPRQHSFSLSPWCSGSLLAEIQARRLPLILWHSETSWDQLDFLCTAYPELSVIVEGTGRKILYDNRMFYQLMAHHPNLYLELHNLTNYSGVEDIVSRFGAGRLVYGSYMPLGDPGPPMAMVTEARISDGYKKLIAYGNLDMLIREVGG